MQKPVMLSTYDAHYTRHYNRKYDSSVVDLAPELLVIVTNFAFSRKKRISEHEVRITADQDIL